MTRQAMLALDAFLICARLLGLFSLKNANDCWWRARDRHDAREVTLGGRPEKRT
jgi:hypothetical protein